MPVALVTGASRGLGRETARALGNHGYEVIVNYLSSEKDAAGVVKDLGNRATPVKADVGNTEDVHAMAQLIEKTFGRLDVIVNNAGMTRDSLLLRQTEEDWDMIVSANLKGPFLVTKELAPLMIRSGGGHILNISSYSGIKGKAGQPAYSASKAALIGLTLSAAREFAKHNICVNAILPAYMPTEMGLKSVKALQKAEEEGLLHRLSKPDVVAASIVQLLQNSYITGQVISLDSRMV